MDVRVQVGVGEHRPLRDARRPAGVLKHGDILARVEIRRRVTPVIVE